MNINELLNKANEIIEENKIEDIIEDTIENDNKEVIIELMEDASEDSERQKELLKRVNNKIELIKDLEGIKISKMGVWLWIEGDTKSNKEQLKEAGFKYASKKKMWYYNPDEFYHKKGRWSTPKNRIAELYGIEEIK